jgi:hypothetical protein
MFYCSGCGQELKIEARIRREEVCPFCGEYLHCCLNCKFLTGGGSRGCNEPQAEEVRDKERANFCDFFVFAEGRRPSSSLDAGARARIQFKSLFQKGPKKGASQG